MTRSRKNRFFFGTVFLAGIFLLIFVFQTKAVKAATSTVRGAGWWGNLGYVYFNCLDDVVGDNLDVTNNLSGAGKYPPPDDLFHFYSAPCVGFSHGVYLNDNNNFSGKAWNSIKDYISFDATTTPPDGYGFNSHCTNPCNLSNSCWACYVPAERKVYGWARVIKDGSWVRMDNATATPVFLQDWDTDNGVLPGHSNVQAGDFVGYATSSPGDLSFNCESEGGGAGSCITRNYKVYISNLRIGHLSAPNWSASSACGGQALKAVLRWYKQSGQYPLNGNIVNSQTAFEVVVNNVDVLSTSTALCWSGKKYLSATSYTLPNSDSTCGDIDFNQNYYWWVRLYDENDQPTQWYQYTTNSASDTDGNRDGNNKTFSTFMHQFPSPYFSWDPLNIYVGTTTTFTSNSSYYTANPTLEHSCAPGLCTYQWNVIGDPLAIISSATNSTTSIIFFLSSSSTRVTLDVTDSSPSNYMCSTSSEPLRINYNLPIWREVKSR